MLYGISCSTNRSSSWSSQDRTPSAPAAPSPRRSSTNTFPVFLLPIDRLRDTLSEGSIKYSSIEMAESTVFVSRNDGRTVPVAGRVKKGMKTTNGSSSLNISINHTKGVGAMKRSTQTMIKAVSMLLVMGVLMSTGCQQKPDASHKLKPLIDKYVEVWNGGDLKELDAFIDTHFVRHVNLQPDVEGVDGLRKVITGFRAAYPDLKIVVNDGVYSDNNSSAGRWTLTGTNTGSGAMPPTGKFVKIWGLDIIHYANGKISEEWVGFDNQSLMEQLGYTMTPPSETKH